MSSNHYGISLLVRDIILKTALSSSTLSKNNFFNRLKLDSEYLYVRVIVKIDDNKYLSLGKGHCIKLSDKKEIKSYISYLTKELAKMFDKYSIENILSLRVIYSKGDKDMHERFEVRNKNILDSSKIDDILSTLSLPKSINYSKLGKLTELSETLLFITDVKLNKNISYISVSKQPNKIY